MINKKMIERMLFSNPLSLLAIKDQQVIDYLNNLIPYSSAFEIECDKSKTYDVENFNSIPYIMDVNNDDYEQRYRIPNGFMGIIALFFISVQLKSNSLLNPLSSIHYHVDCTDCWSDFHTLITNSDYKQEEILRELDTWLTNPNEASCRYFSSWVKLNSLKTLELRLGEMTFEYPILLKRIIHSNAIVKKYKDMLQDVPIPTFKDVDTNLVMTYYTTCLNNNLNKSLYNSLAKLQASLVEEEEEIVTPTEVIKRLVNSRTQYINLNKEI